MYCSSYMAESYPEFLVNALLELRLLMQTALFWQYPEDTLQKQLHHLRSVACYSGFLPVIGGLREPHLSLLSALCCWPSTPQDKLLRQEQDCNAHMPWWQES